MKPLILNKKRYLNINSPDESFSTAILQWFADHGRKNLPWQHDITPYRVWLSEIMLQQTQTATVIPYFHQFTSKYPTIQLLSKASIDDVLALWSGLGYYARGRNLHKTAQIIDQNYGGIFPDNLDGLIKLPGIGRSTAGAIASISMGKNIAILDGNVKRVLCRFYQIEGWPGTKLVENQLWAIAEQLVPQKNCNDYTQAMMDLGATLCTRSKPKCQICPLVLRCDAYQSNNVLTYPYKKPKKDKPIKNTQFLIFQLPNKKILLEKRPSKGIWGGLWSFPELELEQDGYQHSVEKYGCNVINVQKGNTFKHTFSHYHLNIHPIYVQLSGLTGEGSECNDIKWTHPKNHNKIGVPSPIKTLLNQLSIGYYEKNCTLPNAIGQDLLLNVSQQAWVDWMAHQTRLINEKHLSLINKEHRIYLNEQREKFLNDEDFDMAEGYIELSKDK
jgi:A/G-specific adenine glycosylase